jgi:hypothetical protein
MTSFLALHKIAAMHGDGLRPELLKLLHRAHIVAEIVDGDESAEALENDAVAHERSETGTPVVGSGLSFQTSNVSTPPAFRPLGKVDDCAS